MRRASLRWGLPLALALVFAGAGFVAAYVGTAPRDSDLAALRPSIPVVSPTAELLPLSDVARAALSRTVTVEVLRANDEQLGTAWLFDAAGDYVTNAHVITGHITIRLRDRNGGGHVGKVLGEDKAADVAVIRAADGWTGGPALPVVAADPTPGDAVAALASSRATGHGDVTLEEIGRLGVSVQAPDDNGGASGDLHYNGMIAVTGAEIFQGNSGGPLIDTHGRVVGIVTLAGSGKPEAYAIPIARVLPQITGWAHG